MTKKQEVETTHNSTTQWMPVQIHGRHMSFISHSTMGPDVLWLSFANCKCVVDFIFSGYIAILTHIFHYQSGTQVPNHCRGRAPTIQPANQPTSYPTSHPTNQLPNQPPNQPVTQPATQLPNQPTTQPPNRPTEIGRNSWWNHIE
jgi:hypothetical protein